jgi:hypothetical protein
MTPESKQPSAVYASWITVTNALDALAHGVPPNIDRTLFPGLNWAVQNQLITGLKFLRLIDANGDSTPQLVSLAEDTENRRENWAAVLKSAYKDVFDMDLTKASPLQLEQAIQKLGVSGDTLDKAVRFFLSAAGFAGIPLSPHLQRKKKMNGVRKRRAVSRIKNDVPEGATPDDALIPPRPNGTRRTITLRSGGSLELLVSVDLFGLDSDDRHFVFELIDALQAYERRVSAKQAETPVSPLPGEPG